jgi:hypothetical protein
MRFGQTTTMLLRDQHLILRTCAIDEMEPSPEERELREKWFEWYVDRISNHSVNLPPGETQYRCPCCGCRTLDERGGYDICPVCFWEDDGQHEHDADMVRGGPNGGLSLTQARSNYHQFGACDERSIGNVRPPRPDEVP